MIVELGEYYWIKLANGDIEVAQYAMHHVDPFNDMTKTIPIFFRCGMESHVLLDSVEIIKHVERP